MRKATLFLAVVLVGMLAVPVADAQAKREKATKAGKQTYKWVDENGVTHYGDRVPAEYSQREQTILNKQGVVVRKKLAEMSPKEAAEYAAQQKEEARRKQHDMFLISTYPSVAEIENVRDARLDQINGQIVAAEAYISSLTTRVDGLKQRSLNYAPYNTKAGARRMPDDLAEEMVRAMSELRTQDSALNAKKTEFKTVQAQFQADIERFKELRMSAAARMSQTQPKQ
jgi:hypothetical protein